MRYSNQKRHLRTLVNTTLKIWAKNLNNVSYGGPNLKLISFNNVVRWTASLYAYMCIAVFYPSIASAQSTDLDPPSIEIEIVENGSAGDKQVFSATVSDNSAVSSVIFYYRFGLEPEYASVPMDVIDGTNIYTVSIDPRSNEADVIQYYIEARDGGGNRMEQGFAFDPLERVLSEFKPVVAQNAEAAVGGAAVGTGLSRNQKILYGLLGVLTLGVIASASSGGSSSSGNAGSDVDVQILVDTFQ